VQRHAVACRSPPTLCRTPQLMGERAAQPEQNSHAASLRNAWRRCFAKAADGRHADASTAVERVEQVRIEGGRKRRLSYHCRSLCTRDSWNRRPRLSLDRPRRYPCRVNTKEAACITGRSTRTPKCFCALRAHASRSPVNSDVRSPWYALIVRESGSGRNSTRSTFSSGPWRSLECSDGSKTRLLCVRVFRRRHSMICSPSSAGTVFLCVSLSSSRTLPTLLGSATP
jgi:hypothetical protein